MDLDAELDQRNPEIIAEGLPGLEKWLRGYHRVTYAGVENLARLNGPALIVGNHSGGMIATDGMAIYSLFHRIKNDQALYALGHNILFQIGPIERFFRQRGAVPARHEIARRAFERGAFVLVFPGGDVDSLRPWWQRKNVNFGGRWGFVRLAAEAGVPILPVATAGPQDQFFVLSSGKRLARLMGWDQSARVKVAPLILALPWGLAPALLPYWPLPARVQVSILPPWDVKDLPPAGASDAEFAATAEGLRQALEREVGRLYDSR